jgi:DNA polymerase-3 subunit epsilon
MDLSEREKHSALLDCRLLAGVYVELVGGHQARLEFSASAAAGAMLQAVYEGARARPEPLPTRLSDAERLAHEAFVASLGAEALWLPLLTALANPAIAGRDQPARAEAG